MGNALIIKKVLEMFNSLYLSKNRKGFFFWLVLFFSYLPLYPLGEITAIQPLSLHGRNAWELRFLPRGLEPRRILLVLKFKCSKKRGKKPFLTFLSDLVGLD